MMLSSVNQSTRVFLALSACLIGAPAATCRAEKSPAPQYINIAPLPGAGLALDSEGRPDGQGAMQVNIPVAYTPGADFVNVAAYSGQFEGHQSRPPWNNGTGVLGMGFGSWPRCYVSMMAVSSCLFSDSKAVNAQVQLTRESANSPALAVGVQDILDKEHGDFSDAHNTGAGYYAVATKAFGVGGRTLYGTLGYGTGRFLDKPFGGLCAPVSDHLSLAAEYDGFQLNAGLGWRPGGRFSETTILAGYNAEAGPLVGVQTTGKASGWWAIPILLAFLRR